MRTDGFTERRLTLEGWPVRIRSFRIGRRWHATADNVSPGATIAKSRADSRAVAEAAVTETARRRLARTRRTP